jgi:hypothetical protein
MNVVAWNLMGKQKFAGLNPQYRLWLASQPIPLRHCETGTLDGQAGTVARIMCQE